MSIEFAPWPKIARLNRDIVVTEKIDGTNAAVLIERVDKTTAPALGGEILVKVIVGEGVDETVYVVAAQSRLRLLTLDKDNFGFARWVTENASALVAALGEGRHFGEWWGAGIQRGYGRRGQGGKTFSLFNVRRYADTDFSTLDDQVRVVPVLYAGPFDGQAIVAAKFDLAHTGSVAEPGFMDPEGLVVFHTASSTMHKVTIKGDEAPKSQANA